MKLTFSPILFLLLVACQQNEASYSIENSTEISEKQFAAKLPYKTESPTKIKVMDAYDSLESMEIDTTTLTGKRENIMRHFLLENAPSGPDFDTLFDLNYDGRKDYIIGFY